MSTDSMRAVCKHVFLAILPPLLCTLFGSVIGSFFKESVVSIPSLQNALSNLSGMISNTLGFLISYIILVLGFAHSKSIHVIFANVAPRCEFITNMIVPILIGFCLLGYIILKSAMIPDGTATDCAGQELFVLIGLLVSYFVSMFKCILCYFKVIRSVSSEINKQKT